MLDNLFKTKKRKPNLVKLQDKMDFTIEILALKQKYKRDYRVKSVEIERLDETSNKITIQLKENYKFILGITTIVNNIDMDIFQITNFQYVRSEKMVVFVIQNKI